MEIYIAKSGKETGPFTREQIVSMLESGRLTHTDSVRNSNHPGWMSVHQFLQERPNSAANSGIPLVGGAIGLISIGIVLLLIVMILRMNLPTDAELRALYPPPPPHKPSLLEEVCVLLGDEGYEPEPIPPWEISDYVIVKYAERKTWLFPLRLRGLPFCKWKEISKFSSF